MRFIQCTVNNSEKTHTHTHALKMIIEWPIHMNAIAIEWIHHRRLTFSFQFDAFNFSNVISCCCFVRVCSLFFRFVSNSKLCVSHFFRMCLCLCVCSVRCTALVRKVNARICNNLIVAIWFIIFSSIVMSVSCMCLRSFVECVVVVVVMLLF